MVIVERHKYIVETLNSRSRYTSVKLQKNISQSPSALVAECISTRL